MRNTHHARLFYFNSKIEIIYHTLAVTQVTNLVYRFIQFPQAQFIGIYIGIRYESLIHKVHFKQRGFYIGRCMKLMEMVLIGSYKIAFCRYVRILDRF